MIKLTVDNSYCQVEGLDPAQFGQLKELMSYSVENYAAESRGYRPQRRSLLTKGGSFPTGLVYIFDKYVSMHKLPVTRVKLSSRPLGGQGSTFTLSLGVSPYPEQLEAAEACRKAGRGVVCAVTGFGKSVVVALIINQIKVPTLVVVPSLELKAQLSAFLAKTITNGLVTVANIDSLDPKDDFSAYSAVIIDEIHHSAAKSYRELNKKAWKHIYFRFGLTATFLRSNDNERLLLESFLSQVIYEVPYAKAVSKGYIVPVECFAITTPTTYPDGYTWAQVYNEVVVNNDARNEIIAETLDRLADHSTLCLVKEIRHGEILAEMSGLPFASGEGGNSRELIAKFNRGEIKQLIGTTGVLGEGVDCKPAEYVIVAGLGKSRPAFMQAIGRGVRVYPGKESCKVIIFNDRSHKFTINHFNAQRKTLKDEYGVIPVKLTIDIPK